MTPKTKNLITRTIFGILFLAVMIGGILYDKSSFSLLMFVIMLFAMSEFYDICIGSNFHLQRLIAYFCATAFFCACKSTAINDDSTCFMLSSLALLLLIPVSFIFNREHARIENIAFILCGLLYIALPVSLSHFLVFDDGVYDGWKILSLFIIIWASDTGAYCVGSTLGQMKGMHKMAPDISPKKSWWGFAGSLAGGVAAALILRECGVFRFCSIFSMPLVHTIATGLIIGAGSVAGDLVESLWKRRYGLKDSGHVIPGHGGILDRFDSALVAIPCACIYLAFFNLI